MAHAQSDVRLKFFYVSTSLLQILKKI